MEKDKPDAVQMVNQKDKLARDSMKTQINIWRAASDSFKGFGPVQNPRKVHIKVNRLMSDVETVVPRFAGTLLGQRPYLPIRAKKRDYNKWASGIEDIADYFSEGGQFFLNFTEALKYCVSLSISYVEPRYEYWPFNVYQRNPQFDSFGRVVGYDKFTETSVREGMRFVVHHPIAVRPHPFGNSLARKPWVIIVEIVPLSDIEKLIDQGTYKLGKDVSKEDLKKREPLSNELAFELRMDKDQVSSSLQGDVGVLMRYYSEDRWVHTWNRQFVLLDTENQNKNMYRWQKPLVALRNVTHIGPDTWWPIGMYEMGRHLAEWGDKILSRYFQDVVMGSAQWVLYDPNKVYREDLVAEPGNRIPVDGGDFERAIQQMKVAQPSKELFDLYTITQDSGDTLKGLYDYQKGSTPARKETATTTQTLAQAGNTRLEYGVLSIEQTAMSELAYLVTKLIDANVTEGMKREILGDDRMWQVPSLDPDMIPGGYAFQFEGSDRVSRKTQKVETYIQVYNMLRPQQTVQQGAWLLDRKLAQLTETLSDEELAEIGLSEEAQQAAQQQAQMQQGPPQGGPPGASESLGSAGQTLMPPDQVATPATNLETQIGT